MSGPVVPPSYRALIDSPRVSSGTREALQVRAAADDPAYSPVALTPEQLVILRAVLRRLIPQPDEGWIDLAARLDAQLGREGDGWRFAILPDDRTAYARGLSGLDAEAHAEHGGGFADVAGDLQDQIVRRAAAGELNGPLDGGQMRRWMEDVRADAVKLYVAHPATLARIGYGGIAYGGDGPDKSGFVRVGLGEREPWEPMPEPSPGMR